MPRRPVWRSFRQGNGSGPAGPAGGRRCSRSWRPATARRWLALSRASSRTPGTSPTPPRLLYADFAPEHVLYDADAKRIVGVIDWGDLATGAPDYDLLYLRQDYGEDFVGRLLRHYLHPDPARLFGKLRVFDACDHVNTIVASDRDPAESDAIRESVTALGEILDLE